MMVGVNSKLRRGQTMITKINGNTSYLSNNKVQNTPTFKGSAYITFNIAKETLHNSQYNGFVKKCQNFMTRVVFSKSEPLSMELFNLSDKGTSTFKCNKEFDDRFEILAKEFAEKNKFGFSFERGVGKNLE